MTKFIHNSYERHAEHFNVKDEASLKKQAAWFDKRTVDYWRHMRMIKTISPLLKNNKGSRWLTVGDGRFGLDAVRLKQTEPSIDVLPTDISPYLLEKSKELGHIEKFGVENAEKLSFEDESFDYVFCKESYHHFPRPQIALYEMLRVSKKGIIFIEPNDHVDKGVIGVLKERLALFVKKAIGRYIHHHDHFKFEESGNYIFSLSKRELEKIALGINLRHIAYKYMNDAYVSGVEFEYVESNGPLFNTIKDELLRKEKSDRWGFSSPGIIIGIIFKQEPTKQEIEELESEGFTISELPKNPYAN